MRVMKVVVVIVGQQPVAVLWIVAAVLALHLVAEGAAVVVEGLGVVFIPGGRVRVPLDVLGQLGFLVQGGAQQTLQWVVVMVVVVVQG